MVPSGGMVEVAVLYHVDIRTSERPHALDGDVHLFGEYSGGSLPHTLAVFLRQHLQSPGDPYAERLVAARSEIILCYFSASPLFIFIYFLFNTSAQTSFPPTHLWSFLVYH